ncbi:MAG: ABC transporter permease [Kiritimatiellaeota bacterium]|nr:ABC transporter permease [Kiritimatiellota bacterium]
MIRLEHVCKTYRMGDTLVHALDDVSLEIKAGEFIAIMGASGSGKSTLMHLLGLLDRPTSGSHFLFGRDIAGLDEDESAILRSRTVGFVFQQFHLLARTSAEENVALPALYNFDPVPPSRAGALLQAIGLGERLHHKPNELSGGQQQRVAIARSLVNAPRILMADEPTGNLDSASATEIMGLLSELNRRGITIILVTHEPDLAAYANRIVRLRDGKIISDEPNKPLELPSLGKTGSDLFQALENEALTHQQAAMNQSSHLLPSRTVRFRGSVRRVGPLLRQAFRSVAAAKVRSALSMLGILIGVAAIIAMLALGTGAKLAMQKQISSMGSNLLFLYPGATQQKGVSQQIGTSTRLTLEDAAALKAEISTVRNTAPQLDGRFQVVCGNRNWNTYVLGTTPPHLKMRGWELQNGRYFTEEEVKSRARVAVLGITVARELFDEGVNPVGEYVRINKISFQVIGLLGSKGASTFGDQDDVIMIPVTTGLFRLMGRHFVDRINIEVTDMEAIPLTTDRIIEVLKRLHRVPASQEEPFIIRNLAEFQEALMTVTRTMSILLSSIAVISLLVGGIGIMNIMLVSVTERTREIGLRKAIGARRGEIMMQFLVEALAISITGGTIGIALGWGVSAALSSLAEWPTSVSMTAVVLAFGFSGLVGIVFGLWPARKASLLNPIEALRYE